MGHDFRFEQGSTVVTLARKGKAGQSSGAARNGLGMAVAGMGEGERLIGMSRKERKVRVRAKALNDVVLSKKKLIFFIYIN